MAYKALQHQSVLPQAVLNNLLCKNTRSVFDGTLGLGGHARLILAACPQVKFYLGTDLDAQHLQQASDNLADFGDRFLGVEANFSSIADLVLAHPLPRPTAILLDLGVCSNHLDDGEKGFSFQADGPLHMAFSGTQTENCETLVNTQSEQGLTDIMRAWGEEPAAWRIAQRISAYRKHQPIKSTGQLRQIIEEAVPSKDHRKTLTRVFQAFRIATNDELAHLEKALQASLALMQPQDRLGVMSYHSLEDRIVKNFFRTHSRPITEANNFSLHAEVAPAKLKLLTKKPIEPSAEEIEANPRSRSAKFRIVEKC